MNLKINKLGYLGALLIVMISIMVFYYTFDFQVWQNNHHWVSDVPIHTSFVQKFADIGKFPLYSIWYLLVYICSGFSKNLQTLTYSSIILLSLLMVSKYYITSKILLPYISFNKSFVFAFLLIFCMPIISYYTKESYPDQVIVNSIHIYLGNISPNQWHNSTLILAMPFNLILFDFATKRIFSEKKTDTILVGILFILSILCKPNFALAFLPVLVIVLSIIGIMHNNLYKSLFKISIMVVCSIFILGLQYYYTFVHNNLFAHSSKTIFAPFLVWGAYSPHIWFSCLLSLAFPIAVVILYFRQSMTNVQLIISWCSLFIAIIMMATLAESPGGLAGNYFWGAIACNYILFVYSTKLLLIQTSDWKKYLCYSIFIVHVLSGFYLIYSFLVNSTPLII